jgi:hypothetical protein
MIVSWPKQIKTAGIRRQYTHATDIVPTIYDCLGVQMPRFGGHAPYIKDGKLKFGGHALYIKDGKLKFGGHALYIKDGKLKYDYNFVGEFDQYVESSKPVPAGDCVLSASFEKSGTAMPTEGMLSLYINKEKVGEAKIKTQPGKFSLAGEGLNVGLDRAEPVTSDYPSTSPWAFTGGTIHKVTVDVAGDGDVPVRPEPADVVDQHVRPRVGTSHLGGQTAHLRLDGHVGGKDIHRWITRRGADSGRGRRSARLVAAGDADPGAQRGERGGGRHADVPPCRR